MWRINARFSGPIDASFARFAGLSSESPSNLRAYHFYTGTTMRAQTKVIPATAGRQSEYMVAQKSRASALADADDLRAQKRLESDARIDVNASKWRYVCPGA
jgi:hypothetical protein